MRLFGVTGHPVLHSRSPEMFRRLFSSSGIDAAYTRIGARTADEALALARRAGVAGLNVTSPFKEDVYHLVENRDEQARRLGAVNTVVTGDGSTAAHNTVTVGVGDPDQHELWASHRIGARAEPGEIERAADRLAAWVHGWASPARHTRTVQWDGQQIAIADVVDPDGVPATVRYFLPAELSLRATPNGFVVFLPKGNAFEIACDDAKLVITDALGWRAIGVPAARRCLAARVPAGGIVVRFRAID